MSCYLYLLLPAAYPQFWFLSERHLPAQCGRRGGLTSVYSLLTPRIFVESDWRNLGAGAMANTKRSPIHLVTTLDRLQPGFRERVLFSVLRSCVKVEVAGLGSPSLINLIPGFCGRKGTLNRVLLLGCATFSMPSVQGHRQATAAGAAPYNHAQGHFMQSHIRKVHVYLAVTCPLHFWQNDRGLLRATAATRG